MALEERYSALLDKCVTSLERWQKVINDNELLEEQEKVPEYEKLRKMTKEYCIIDNKHRASQMAIDQLKQQDFTRGFNVEEMYQKYLSEQTVPNYTDNNIWTQLTLNDSIVEVKTKKQKQGKMQYEQLDDSLMCSSSFSIPIDPISKKPISKPLKNKRCLHVYDKDPILDYIRQSKKRAKCPYVGCKNDQLVPNDLKEDAQLEERIKQFIASKKDLEDESSDEDDDDD